MSWQEMLQLAGLIGPVLAVVATGIWWCIQRHLRYLWARISSLQNQVKALTEEKERFQREFREGKIRLVDQDRSIDGLKAQLKKVRKRKQFLRLRVDDFRNQIRTLRISSLGPDLKALLENRVVELQQQLQEARTDNENLLTRARNAETLAGQREAQLTQLKQEKIQAEEASRTITVVAQKLREGQQSQVEKIEKLNDEVDTLTTRSGQLEEELAQKRIRLDAGDKEIFDLKTQIGDLQAQIEGTVEQRGRVWERQFQVGAIPFQSLSDRQMPIISILNLKGGVGKTTITANLGAMLGMQGTRVLLIDLDYQRSMSLLCCSADQIKQLHQSRRSLQHFLLDPKADANRLLGCAAPVKAADGCEIVINSDALESSEKGDNLEDAEMHLLAEWLTNPTGPDIRLALRKALHSPLIRERFDYVLLDCPPRLSTACINALAASDFALVPVMLDYTSANSVPNLLRKLRHLHKKDVLAELGVLGVLANRVTFYRDKLVNAQAVVWDDLRLPCQVAWGKSVYFFDTLIKQSAGVAEAASRHSTEKATRTLAVHDPDLKPIFYDLVQEMRKRIDHESKEPTAVSL